MVENEIQYVPWRQFQQMVPSILRLEVRRLTRYLVAESPSVNERNIIVKVRYDIRLFVQCIGTTTVDEARGCARHLASALLNAALLPKHPVLTYVMDRLQYVRNRMPFIY